MGTLHRRLDAVPRVRRRGSHDLTSKGCQKSHLRGGSRLHGLGAMARLWRHWAGAAPGAQGATARGPGVRRRPAVALGAHEAPRPAGGPAAAQRGGGPLVDPSLGYIGPLNGLGGAGHGLRDDKNMTKYDQIGMIWSKIAGFPVKEAAVGAICGPQGTWKLSRRRSSRSTRSGSCPRGIMWSSSRVPYCAAAKPAAKPTV